MLSFFGTLAGSRRLWFGRNQNNSLSLNPPHDSSWSEETRIYPWKKATWSFQLTKVKMLLSACSLSFQIKHTIRHGDSIHIKSHQISLLHFAAIGGSEALDAANPKARTKSARRAPSGGRPDIPSGGREACYSKHLNPMQDLSNWDVPGAIRIVKVYEFHLT